MLGAGLPRPQDRRGQAVTPTLALFAVTVALAAGGLVVIAMLCAIRSWQEGRRG